MKKLITAVIMTAAVIAAVCMLASCRDGKTEDTDAVTSGTAGNGAVTTAPATEKETQRETDAEPMTDTEPVDDTEPVTEDVDTDTDTDTDIDTDIETVIIDVMTEPFEDDIVYVALGDSIAYGYALENIEADRYSTLVEKYLDDNSGRKCRSVNYGINGLTSGGLVDDLATGFAPELENADLITVSIGANNVLGPSISMLTQYTLNLFVGDVERTAELNTALYKQFIEQTETGIADFERDLPNIIALLRAKAPDARIIFQTVYSPYANFNLTLDFAVAKTTMAAESDRLVGRLNDIIKKNADKLGYEVADVYSAFDGKTGLINAGTSGGATVFSGFDPHPTKAGHRVIADVICELLKEAYG